MGRRLLVVFVLLPALVGADSAYRPLPTELSVGPFRLQERGGETVARADLRGKVWVAHFFFTTCTGPCTKTLPAMRELQKTFKGRPDVRLVSITVNSAHDTPERLRAFADDLGADTVQWQFLTGPEAAVHEIIQKSFFQAVQRNPNPAKPGDEIDHSAHLLVIDRDGNIDGYADGTKLDAAGLLADRIRAVAGRRYRLPAFNAVLNSLSALLLVLGYLAIRRRHEKLHTTCMLGALLVSTLFLSCYLYFHFVVLDAEPTRFRGEGWIRPLYFFILLTHTVLAALVAPLALYVSYQGWFDRRSRHVRVARWTLPIWLYVSVTGVIVYWLLYQVYPPY